MEQILQRDVACAEINSLTTIRRFRMVDFVGLSEGNRHLGGVAFFLPTRATTASVSAIVAKHPSDNPEHWNRPASALVTNADQDAPDP